MKPFSLNAVDRIKPVVAGRFYPADRVELERDVRQYLEEADIEPSRKPLVVLLSPHAGYVFSGPTAGFSFRHAQNQNPDTVLILSLSHHHAIDGGCMAPAKFFETPLGRIPVDLELTGKLVEPGKPIYADVEPYLTEHSVEVNLPFVQTVFPKAQIASMLISHSDLASCREIGQRIAQTILNLPEKRILIVVSSDMSHYPNYELASRIDKEMLASLETLDSKLIDANLERLGNDPAKNVHCVMCGGAAMLTAVEAARALGAKEARTLCYRNSGDSSYGDNHRVVGYGSLAIYADSPAAEEDIPIQEKSEEEFYLNDDDRKTLLAIARSSIASVLHQKNYEPHSENSRFKASCGVFVTLKNEGQLRGCLGRFEAGDLRLDQITAVMAAQSATHDIRFKPVSLDELPSIDIQISVLTPREPVRDIHEITIGKHGLQIQGRNRFGVIRSGTLLPQVATEQGWDVEAFLDATCVKAGLDSDSWRDAHTDIWKYGALVFGDLDYGAAPYSMPA